MDCGLERGRQGRWGRRGLPKARQSPGSGPAHRHVWQSSAATTGRPFPHSPVACSVGSGGGQSTLWRGQQSAAPIQTCREAACSRSCEKLGFPVVAEAVNHHWPVLELGCSELQGVFAGYFYPWFLGFDWSYGLLGALVQGGEWHLRGFDFGQR